jgi:hypothetical protein
MRRMFWLAVGAGAAVVATRRARRVAESVSPGGISDRVTGLGEVAREFAADVRVGMAIRELELRESLGLTDGPGDGTAAEHEPRRGRATD